MSIFWLFRIDFNVLQTKYPFSSPCSFLCSKWTIVLLPLWLQKHYLLENGSLRKQFPKGAADGTKSSYSLSCAWGDLKCQNFPIETKIKSLYRDSCGWVYFFTQLLYKNLMPLDQNLDRSTCPWLCCLNSNWRLHICSCKNKITQSTSLRDLGQQNKEKKSQ